MAVLLLTRDNLPIYLRRLDGIQSDSKSRWGALDATGLMAHLTRSIEISLGEYPAPDKSTLLSRTVLRWLFFHALTNWPKGKIKAPEYFTPDAEGDFESERVKLNNALERFADASENHPQRKQVSELLGPISLKYWSRVNGVHMNHHLKQFGV